MLNLEPVSSFFSLFQIPKHSIETYCPYLMFIFMVHYSLLSVPSIIPLFFQSCSESSVISQPCILLTKMTLTPVIPPRVWPRHHYELGWLLFHINIWLIFHHLWGADQLTDISLFCDSLSFCTYFYLSTAIIVLYMLLSLPRLLFKSKNINLFIHSKKQRA